MYKSKVHILNYFFIFMVPCIVTILIRSNKMQQYAGIYLLQNHSNMFRVSIAPIVRST